MKNFLLPCFLFLLSIATYSQTFETTALGTVPDNGCPASTDFPISVTGVGTLGAIGGNAFAQIEININMGSDGDLNISLVAPNGTTVVPLSIGQGGAGDNFTHTVFRSDATMTLEQGVAPFTGNFFPDGDFSVLNGLVADGIWKLRICDHGTGDTAAFLKASLTFEPAVPVTCSAPIYVVAAEGGVTPTSVHFIWSGGGSLNYLYVLDESPANPVVTGTATSAISFDAINLKPETNYYFHVRNNCGISNGFSTWSKAVITTPPVNDDCLNSIHIEALPFNKSQNILGATNKGNFVMGCGNGMNDGAWYTVNVGEAGNLKIDVTGVSGWNPEVAVYSGTCGQFTCVGSADIGGPGVAESLSLNNLKPGRHWINIGDGSGTVDNLEGDFSIDVTGDAIVLGTNTFELGNFSFYPNPVRSLLNLSYNRPISNVAVYNLLGQEVAVRPFNSSLSQIDMSGLSSGNYIVKVKSENHIQTIKVIKE